MENKKKNIDEKSLERWAYRELFDSKEAEEFLEYCEDELFISRFKMVTKQRFISLMASFGF